MTSLPEASLAKIGSKYVDEWSKDLVRLRIEHKQELAKLGWIGRQLGSPEAAPTNVAAVVTLILVSILAAVALWGGEDRLDMLKILGGFFLASLGYMFGTLSGRKS